MLLVKRSRHKFIKKTHFPQIVSLNGSLNINPFSCSPKYSDHILVEIHVENSDSFSITTLLMKYSKSSSDSEILERWWEEVNGCLKRSRSCLGSKVTSEGKRGENDTGSGQPFPLKSR